MAAPYDMKRIRLEKGLTRLLRLLAQPGNRRARRDRLRIDAQLDHRGLAGRAGPLERGRELRRLFDRLAMTAERARIRGEIRIAQPRARDASRGRPLLMHANHAVHAIA